MRWASLFHVDVEDSAVGLFVVEHGYDVVGATSLGEDHLDDDGWV